jgi:putative transcriptional regulator
MQKSAEVKSGTVLLAQPFMEDPYFESAVVLLCDDEGSLGFILNKPLDLKLGDLIPEIAGCEFPVYYGGPVEGNTFNYIHRHGGLIGGSEKVMRGLWLGGDFDDVKFLINQGLIEQHDIMFFIGYTGWGANQLSEELTQKSWIPTPGDLNYMFQSEDPALLWHEIMTNKGGHYQVLANMPYEMTWN